MNQAKVQAFIIFLLACAYAVKAAWVTLSVHIFPIIARAL